MDINDDDGIIEPVTMSDILQLSSWNRPRNTAELLGFIARHEAALAEDSDSS